MPTDKSLLRAALRLRDVYLSRAAEAADQALLQRLAGYQQALESSRAALRQAAVAGWANAGLQVRRSLWGLVQAVQDAVDQTRQDMLQPAQPLADRRNLVEELRQLDQEFGGLDVDLKNKIIQVTTEPIELEDVYLGRFAIQFSWPRLAKEAGSHCFAILAQEPNPAASNEGVTHPHVNHDRLCAGEGTVPIQRALEQGRLADAFCLVRSVLTHYNPSSAHVPLDDWGGQSCFDCGGNTAPDDLCYCEQCGHDYCEECISRCATCRESCCNSCLQVCPLCQEWCCSGCLIKRPPSGKVCCRSCLRTCGACGGQFARDERDPQSQQCPACRSPRPASAAPPDVGPEALVPSPSSLPETVHESTDPVPALS
jgi:hypothetical protein